MEKAEEQTRKSQLLALGKKDNSVDLQIGENFSEKDFSKIYELTEHVISYGDFFEIRECVSKKTLEKRTAKIFRKLDLRDKFNNYDQGM